MIHIRIFIRFPAAFQHSQQCAFQFPRLDIERLKLLVQFLKALLEIKIVSLSLGYANITSRVQAPALRLDLGK